MPTLVLVTQATATSSYSASHIRHLIRTGLVRGEKQGGIWLVDADDLQRYEQTMQQLGTQKHTPKNEG